MRNVRSTAVCGPQILMIWWLVIYLSLETNDWSRLKDPSEA
jgi:hypothetical protein